MFPWIKFLIFMSVSRWIRSYLWSPFQQSNLLLTCIWKGWMHNQSELCLFVCFKILSGPYGWGGGRCSLPCLLPWQTSWTYGQPTRPWPATLRTRSLWISCCLLVSISSLMFHARLLFRRSNRWAANGISCHQVSYSLSCWWNLQ